MAAEMRFLGVIFIAVQAMRAMSFPVSSPTSEGDTKVMKCIVEVISDTLSKPSPLPISQSCLETLRRDERIISILRHRNLLKELQELAAQGATERVQKKSGVFEDEPSGVLESQNNKPEASEISEEITETPKTSSAESSSESHETQTEEEEEDKEQEAPESSREENIADELESNDIDKREPAAADKDIDNHITDHINDQDLPAEDNTSDVHNSEEKEAAAENKTESSETEETRDAEKADSKADSEEAETQRDDESMTAPEEHELEKDETSLDGRNSKDGERLDGGNSHYHEHRSEEETSSAELDDSKRFNKMDELAKQLTSKKWAEENGSEEAGLGSKERKYDPGTQESDERRPWQHPRGDSTESESQTAKRPDPEEKKEEGSANRKTEDQELESLAAIEAELEKVAHKLHELRRV